MDRPDYGYLAGDADEAAGAAPPAPPYQPLDCQTDYLTKIMDLREKDGVGIPQAEFPEWDELISGNFGIKVGKNKLMLVSGRIHPMLEKHGFADYRACLAAIRNDSSGRLLSELANRISTNHTSFYREEAHFQLLTENILPDLIERKRKAGNPDLRVWCAACATGEEAYSILFCLLNFLHSDYSGWQSGVLATDISASALKTASAGRYDRRRLEPVPRNDVLQYFSQLDDNWYEVKEEFRREITFRRLNLINDAYPFRQLFDIIFCRNVMIYFPAAVRKALLENLRIWLEPGGYLFIGHSESLLGSRGGYKYVAPAVYSRLP
ncbi:MAG: protein-glutamate O-methyltransferase CheR [Planctomycetota bacterium]|jgi:chemotaxis protein methyltransferase CheR|nr:protein-glutamate O-methyltransferase CheR [Planctomycetota bacterium]